MTTGTPKPKIYPLVWLALAIAAMLMLHFFWPWVKLIPPPYHWTGGILLLVGAGITVYSGSTFLQAKTGLIPFSEATTLVTDGFFRVTRNPMYLGMALFLLGLALLLGALSPFLPVVCFVFIIDHRFIRNEERFLIETFGDEYQNYMKRVRRWI